MSAGKGGHHHKCTHSRAVRSRAQQDSLPQQGFIPPTLRRNHLASLRALDQHSSGEGELGVLNSECSGPERQVGSAGRLGTEEKAFENKRDSYYL